MPDEAQCPELLPCELRIIQFPRIDPEWCWVVEHSELGPIALLLASNCHGVLMFWRVLATAKTRSIANWFLAAFPKILENARLRGCVGYGAFFHDDRPEEVKFARLLARHRGSIEPFSGSFGVAFISGVEGAGPRSD